MRKVLITGVNGFVGQYLAEALVKKGYEVIGTGKAACRVAIDASNFIYESLDFTDEKAVEKIFTQYQPAVIVHAGAISKPDECEQNKEHAFQVNVEGAKVLLAASAVYKAYFIYLSSDFVFSGKKEIYKEEDAGEPVNYYGQTKLLAEAEVIAYPFNWTVVRTVLVYGKPIASRHNLLTNVANALQKGETLNIYNDQFRTPTYVEDLVSGIVSIIEQKATGVYHLSGEDLLTPYQMACAVAEYLNLNKELIKAVRADTFKQPALRPPRTVFDLAKARQTLGYIPTPFTEGLKRTFRQ